ncbi:MAG: plasmid mobilization relaxosome protein MobC [Thermodesulfobacteriota bacterium]
MSHYISVRLNDKLARLLADRATTEKNRSVVIRRALKSYLDDRPAGDPGALRELAQEVGKLVSDMGRVGANLNQLARYFNTHSVIQPHELATEHRELRRQLRALMTILKRLHGQLNERKD